MEGQEKGEPCNISQTDPSEHLVLSLWGPYLLPLRSTHTGERNEEGSFPYSLYTASPTIYSFHVALTPSGGEYNKRIGSIGELLPLVASKQVSCGFMVTGPSAANPARW